MAEFEKLLQGRGDVELVRLLLEFAADLAPDLDADACLAEVARLAGRVARRLRGQPIQAATLADCLRAASEVLYVEEGFHGNREDYYDPRNSQFHEVLHRRCGIPITLAVLYCAVTRPAGLPVFGVATPGHFMVGCCLDDAELYVDPYAEGELLDRHSCRERVEQVLGRGGVVQDEHFRPATPRDIAARVLRNLKASYVMRNGWPEALLVQERLSQLLHEERTEQRDLGLLCLRNGQPQRALRLLTAYTADCDEAEALALEPYLRSARRLLFEMN
jgi:regulator of sirC expression with transglutaminase-like and TPR domain